MPDYSYARSQGRNRFGRRHHSKYVTKGYLKAVVGTPESKFIDTQLPLTQLTTPTSSGTPNVYPLNTLVQGTGQSQRIGNQVSNKSLHMRLELRRIFGVGTVNSNLNQFVRVIIFWALDGTVGNAVTGPAITPQQQSVLLLEDPSNYQSPLNKEYGKSFWVKFDRTYTLASGQSELQTDEIWRKVKCSSEYNDAASSLVGTTRNALYVLFITSAPSAAQAPSVAFYSRLNYMDN